MKTYDLAEKLLKEEGTRLYNVNSNMMQVARANGKRRPAYVKVSIGDGDAEKLLRTIQPHGVQAFMIVADIEVVNRLLDEEKGAVQGEKI
jgi:hypothetical protein